MKEREVARTPAPRVIPRGDLPPYLIFQNVFSGQLTAFGPGELMDPEGPSIIMVLSTEGLRDSLDIVH